MRRKTSCLEFNSGMDSRCRTPEPSRRRVSRQGNLRLTRLMGGEGLKLVYARFSVSSPRNSPRVRDSVPIDLLLKLIDGCYLRQAQISEMPAVILVYGA